MKALVTGGAGFIGSHVVNKLIENNIETKVLVSGFRSNNHPSIVNEKATIIKGNLIDYESLLIATENIDMVFHLGGIFSHYCEKYPELTIDVNIKGTWNLKKACVINGVKRIIYASSSFVYGDTDKTYISENDPINPKDLLGVTKISSEKILQSTYPYKIDYIILRLFNVYGTNQYPDHLYTSVLSTWIRKALNGNSLEIHDNGTQSLDFVNADDVADAFVLSMNEQVKNEIFNVGRGISISMNELAKLVNKITKNEKPPFYNSNHPMFLKNVQANIKKIEYVLGWKPKIGIEEGLIKIIGEIQGETQI